VLRTPRWGGVAAESACLCERVELSDVRVSKPNGESMFEFLHFSSIGIAIALSREKFVLSARISRRR
jgi:hypothetical protein